MQNEISFIFSLKIGLSASLKKSGRIEEKSWIDYSFAQPCRTPNTDSTSTPALRQKCYPHTGQGKGE